MWAGKTFTPWPARQLNASTATCSLFAEMIPENKKAVWNADFFWSESILGWAEEFWVRKRLQFLGWFLLLSERRLYFPWIRGYLAYSYRERPTCPRLSFSPCLYASHWNIFFISVSLPLSHSSLKGWFTKSKISNIKEYFSVTRVHARPDTHTHTRSQTLPCVTSWKQNCDQGPQTHIPQLELFFSTWTVRFFYSVVPPA